MTILPDQFISGDAITYCLAALEYRPPQLTYLYDVLLSVATESQLWNTLWRFPRTTQARRVSTIILPINVQNVHWYVAILHIDEEGVKLTVRNDIDMRSKHAETKLLNVGRKYHRKMWTQAPLQSNTVTKETTLKRSG